MKFIHDKERSKMVRVISCHHFQAQDVFTVDGEPVALCTAGDLLLVATLQHCVEVWDLHNPGKLLHCFPTVDQAKQMVYCQKGEYVGALEVRASRQAVMSFVRIYLNWQIDMKGQPMRARIAGRVTPSSQSGIGVFEMVELPLKKEAFCIAACSETGNLAIGLGIVVSIYRFCTKTHDLSRRTFCDLEPLLDVTLQSLSAHHLALNEDVLACLSPNELHIVKIKLQPDNFSEPVAPVAIANQTEVTPVDKDEPCVEFDVENFVVKDENFVVWNFDSASPNLFSSPSKGGSYECLRQKLHPDSWPLVVRLPGLTECLQPATLPSEVREVLGPSGIVPIQSELHSIPGQMVRIVTLLYRHFLLDQEISSGLHSLHLMPVYSSGAEVELDLNHDNPFLESRSHLLCGLTCFFSSPQHGFLYDLIDSVRLVVTYPYTSAARAVTLEDYLLHAVTEAGLETYTLRSVHCALHHVQAENSLLPRMVDDPVCLVGLQAFLNVEQMVLSQHRLVLLSAISDESSSSQESDSNCWTVYSLTHSSCQEFYHDMLEVANAHREKSPSTYIHLLGEAHCILRGELLTKTNPESIILELFKDSCCLMGDFFLMSENVEENGLAVSYYQMSECPIQAVVSRVLQLWAQAHPMPLPVKGLMDYLNRHLLDKGKKHPSVDQSMADTILDLYADNEPNKLATVIIRGQLTEFTSEKAVSLLKKRILSKRAFPEDIVALSWLYIQAGHSDQAMSLLSTIPKERLIDVLVQQCQLWTKERRFSKLAQSVRNWRPDIFVEATLQMVFSDAIAVRETIDMFQEATPDMPHYKIPHLKEYLEALLTGNKSSVWSTEAPQTLALIYVGRMKEGPRERQSQTVLRALNLFGIRPSWLNSLPPFEGGDKMSHGISFCIPTGHSARDPCVNKQLSTTNDDKVTCPCWECNEELLRLQSLICHEMCPPNVGIVLLEAIKVYPSLKGALSLHVLCVAPADVATLLADDHPLSLIDYGKDSFGDNLEEWQLVRDLLLSRLKQTTAANSTSYKQALQMLLSHLAEILPPAAFLDILPSGESTTYLPYVQRCCQKHQASLLRERIIAKGLELKGMV